MVKNQEKIEFHSPKKELTMPKKHSIISIFRSEIGSRILTILVIISVLAIAILLSGPKPDDYTVDTAAVSQQVQQPNADPAANLAGLISEPSITSGVIVATTTVLLIIFVGTLLVLRRTP
jgi:hypothetical protein